MQYRRTVHALLVLTGLCAGSCTEPTAPGPVLSLTLSPLTATIESGATLPLTASPMSEAGRVLRDRRVTWSSSDTLVASVSATGVLRATSITDNTPRTVTITASSEGISAAADITVLPLRVAHIVAIPASPELATGASGQLAVSVLSADSTVLTGRPLVWSTVDTLTITLSPTGFVTTLPYTGGQTRIATVLASTDGVTGTAILSVLPAPVVSVSVTPISATVASGGTRSFSALPKGYSGTPLAGRAVDWSSGNPAMASVSPTGVVTAGTNLGGINIIVPIIATSSGVSGSATLSVQPSPVAAVALSVDSITIFPADTLTLTASLTNSAGDPLTGRTIAWVAIDTTVARVNAAGLVTAAVYAGPDTRGTLIVGTVAGIADTVRVAVLPSEVATVDVAPQTAIVPVGAQQTFTVTARDAGGRVLTGRTVTWATGTPGVTTIDAGGVATVIASGNATVTASIDEASGAATVGTAPEPLVASTLVGGGYHNCALTNAGRAYCWGYNIYGQLGDGTNTDHDFPAPVSGGITFKSLAGGSMFTCGLTPAGTAYCWGWNASGQLGDGTHNSRSTPVPVLGGFVFDTLVAGWYHVCGLSGGETYCWGRNHLGQMGDSTANDTNSPVRVLGGHTFVTLATRYTHTCGLTSTGQVWCWGRNQWGALGDGTLVNRNYPVRAQGNVALVSIKVGWDHTCGLAATGAAYCLGRNQYGQNADLTTTMRPAFVAVSGGQLFTAIAPGMYHNCALTSTGESWCWGYNNRGQVGDGTLVDKVTPIHVNVGQTFLSLASGYSHACGMTTGGSIMCWGIMTDGLLGDAAPLFPPDARAGLRRVAASAPLSPPGERPQ